MMRLLSICLVAALVLAAADVYKIKFESTRQSQRLARLRMDIRQEQNAIAALRAQWSKLDSPSRIEELARRHLSLRPTQAQQYDQRRAQKLAGCGVEVLRFPDDQLLKYPDAIAETIYNELERRRPSPCPLPEYREMG